MGPYFHKVIKQRPSLLEIKHFICGGFISLYLYHIDITILKTQETIESYTNQFGIRWEVFLCLLRMKQSGLV